MNNTYNQLKNELSVLYPDVTDIELNEITTNLIDFFTTAVKSVLEDDNQDKKNLNFNNFLVLKTQVNILK